MADTLLIPYRARSSRVAAHTGDPATKLSDRVRRRCFQYVEK
jgi:hypothetical protein